MTTAFYTNLLLNPGAEDGFGSSSGNDLLAIPDWTTFGNFNVVDYGASGFPDAPEAVPIGGGNHFFAGGPNSVSSSAYQDVSFADLATDIDNGGVVATLSGYLGGYFEDNDHIALSATWLDSLGDSLGSFTLPLIQAAARGDTTGFQFVSSTVLVPAGAVGARITMAATRTTGSFDDGYADNLSFTLSPASPPSPYGSNLLLNPGAEAGTGSFGGNDVLAIPDWTTSGNFTSVLYSTVPNGLTDAQAQPIGGGDNYFAGGPNTSFSSASQTVSFASVASDIASGWTVTATLGAYVGGLSNNDDHMTVTATWLDQNDQSLGSFTLPIVEAAARDDGTALQYVSATVTVPSGAVAATVELDAIGSTGYDSAYADNISLTLIPCYCRGTMIATPRGEQAIETLAIGDLVVTRGRSAKPIKWIGRRGYSGRFIDGNRDILPIRFAAHAIADGAPYRDLDVSPKHAMFIDGVLVPAELLVNGVSIRQLESVESVEYFHIELDAHDVIVAAGALSETFVDCDSRGMFHNAHEFARHYPDDDRPGWQFCAERLEHGAPALQPIRAWLAARAGVAAKPDSLGELRGCIDRCDRTGIAGWACDAADPLQRVRLALRVNGQIIGEVVADRYRDDLRRAGLGDGRCAFELRFPAPLVPSERCEVGLHRIEDSAELPGSPLVLKVASGLDAGTRDWLAQCLADEAAAADATDALDPTISFLLEQVDALRDARARLQFVSARPHALFIDDILPRRDGSAGENAVLSHMESLARLGFEVCCVASQDSEGTRALHAPWYGSIEEVLRRNRNRCDLIYLHRAGNAARYLELARLYCPRALLVYSVADLHHLRLARQAAVEERPELAAQARRLREQELAAARAAHVVITHSSAEAAMLRAVVSAEKVHVVPWTVPVQPIGTPFEQRSGIGFLANYAHEPNVDAAVFLAETVLPLVWHKHPDIACRLAGRAMPDAVRRLARPGLLVMGEVSTPAELFEQVRLSVAPLRFGAGLKGKLMESLGAGLPCVATPIAAEGMELPSVLADLVADTPELLADAIVRLHNGATANAAASEAGLHFVRAQYACDRIDALLRRVANPVLRRCSAAVDQDQEPPPMPRTLRRAADLSRLPSVRHRR